MFATRFSSLVVLCLAVMQSTRISVDASASLRGVNDVLSTPDLERRLGKGKAPATAPSSSSTSSCATTKAVSPQVLNIDISSNAGYVASINKARTAIQGATGTTAKGKKCYATSGWTMQVSDGTNSKSISMGDDVYLMDKAWKLDYDNSKNDFMWSRASLESALFYNSAKDAPAVYALAESIRFDWVKTRVGAVLGVDKDQHPGAGFKMPKAALLNNWAGFEKQLGVTESQAATYMKQFKFTEEWRDVPGKTADTSAGGSPGTVKPNAGAGPSGSKPSKKGRKP